MDLCDLVFHAEPADRSIISLLRVSQLMYWCGPPQGVNHRVIVL